MAVLRISALALAAVLVAPAAARADDAASAFTSWNRCLDRAYVDRAAFTGHDPAADAALRACRGEETAYLTALSASPLLDADDIAQARPELIARARAALTAAPRAVLR